MLITPPAAARFWTDKLQNMVVLAALFGGLSGALGTLLSTLAPRMPTGPLIVLSATAIFAFSLLFAPRRGALARLWRIVSTQRAVRRENVLRDLFELTEEAMPATMPTTSAVAKKHEFLGASITDLLQKRRGNAGALRAALSQLARRGWVRQTSGQHWILTESGMSEAYRVVRQHRLWEMFLMYETTLGLKSVDRDADAVEHFVPPEALRQLESLLEQHGREPRLRPASP